MVKRIIPEAESLAARERKAIEDMRALFPDGNVIGLDIVTGCELREATLLSFKAADLVVGDVLSVHVPGAKPI